MILDTFSYTFCFLKKKIWGDTKKDMGPSSIYALKATIFFLLTWGVWALGTNKCPHKPSKWVMRNENLTKIDWMGAKNNLSYFQEIWSYLVIKLLRALKKQVFDQKRHFFRHVGVPPDGFLWFSIKNDPPKKLVVPR